MSESRRDRTRQTNRKSSWVFQFHSANFPSAPQLHAVVESASDEKAKSYAAPTCPLARVPVISLSPGEYNKTFPLLVARPKSALPGVISVNSSPVLFRFLRCFFPSSPPTVFQAIELHVMPFSKAYSHRKRPVETS